MTSHWPLLFHVVLLPVGDNAHIARRGRVTTNLHQIAATCFYDRDGQSWAILVMNLSMFGSFGSMPLLMVHPWLFESFKGRCVRRTLS